MEGFPRNPRALPPGNMANVLINCLPPEPFCLCPTHRVISENMAKRKNNLTICLAIAEHHTGFGIVAQIPQHHTASCRYP